MTKFTKTTNFILRGTIVAALGVAAATLATGGSIIGKATEGMKDAEAALANMVGCDFSGVIGTAKMMPLVLLVAALLSCAAFKCAGKVSSTLRTLALFGAAAIAAGSSAMFGAANTIARSIQGTASAAEAATVKPMIDVFAKEGVTETAVGGTATAGMALMVLAGAILVILTLTSIVSVVKTIKASSNENMKACAA